MKAMLLINHKGGSGKITKQIDYIKNFLKNKFEIIDTFVCEEESEFSKHCLQSCGNYDALLFAGGDGTFNLVINTLAKENNVPILGVIPSGTLCDAAKNFGASKNVKKALKIIEKGSVTDFDIANINDQFFVFEASYGIYSDIPYSVKDKTKKRFGHFAYYLKAFPELFEKSKIKMKLTLDDDRVFDIETPFLLVMNSSYMAGFKINKNSNISDGLIDVFYSKPEPFNGLLSYFFFKKRVTHYQAKKIDVEVNDKSYWDVDGEQGMSGNVTISVIEKKFKMFYKNKNN